MQSRTLLLILSIGALAAFGGCERHHWEDTRKLHQGHGGDEHGDSQVKPHKKEGDDHGKGSGGHARKEEEAHAKPKTEEKIDGEKPKGQSRTL